jgi:hypothetical protein
VGSSLDVFVKDNKGKPYMGQVRWEGWGVRIWVCRIWGFLAKPAMCGLALDVFVKDNKGKPYMGQVHLTG